jgi:ribose transport system ATP-binding protein
VTAGPDPLARVAPPLVEMRNVSKSFPGVRALDDVSLTVQAGEVHGLVGQNGAGKSTLIKVLCGAYRPDHGEILIGGRRASIDSPADARRLGIAVIFQEFSLVPYLDIAQNIFLGREPGGAIPGFVDRGRLHHDARALLGTLGLDLDTYTPVHRLGVAQQQMVEIAKALSQEARILVLDEPTAALSAPEIHRLFAQLRRLRGDGIAMVYISHRLQEIFEIGDRITVLRDGKRVASVRPAETSAGDLVRTMVGRDVDTRYRQRFCDRPGAPALEVRNLHAANGVHGASLQVCEGEVVGLAGLVGAGRTELARAIFGVDPTTEGSVHVNGAALASDPPALVSAGVAFVPENRKMEGLALGRSIQDNVLLAGLRRLFPSKWYQPRPAAQAAGGMIDRLRIATPSPWRPVSVLSGGNQQKVVIGKWLVAGSRVFVFDEPTRGIDVGAKAEIFRLIENLVDEGAAVLLISSELPEIVAVCDRAYVMRDKTIVGELRRPELTETRILTLAMTSSHHGPGMPA